MNSKHPQVDSILELYKAEVQAFRKVHRLIDLFETIIKTHTAIILAEYFKVNAVSDNAKALLSSGLKTPSLGTWQLFSRELFTELKKNNHNFLIPDFESNFEYLDKALNEDKTNVIAFRNSYAHGATPTDKQCLDDIEKFNPFLTVLLDFNVFKVSEIVLLNDLVHLTVEEINASICLHPIVVCRYENIGQPYVFFNDLKNDKVSFLNYPLRKHYKEKEFFNEFQEYLPLNQWKKKTNNEFKQRIEELSDSFKGRVEERNEIIDFLLKYPKGYLFIYGEPGIGKSALLAKTIMDLGFSQNKNDFNIVNYFVRRGTCYASPEFMLDYFYTALENLYPIKISRGENIGEKKKYFIERLKAVSELKQNKKLVLIIDGLDEGVDQEYNIVDFLPAQVFENVLIVYGSRRIGAVEGLHRLIEVDSRKEKEILGLKSEDIRALLYDVADKYRLEDQFVESIQLKSNGNPLYIKLLCISLENGEFELNKSHKLPGLIEDFYEDIIYRFSKKSNGNYILKALYVFAVAKDYLTPKHIELILSIGEADAANAISDLREVLFENPATEEDDFQLFHESFREYLYAKKNLSVKEAGVALIKYCRQWRDLLVIDPFLVRYVYAYYSTHLFELNVKEELIDLALDRKYLDNQTKETLNRNLSFLTIEQALRIEKEMPFELSRQLYLSALHVHSASSLSSKDLRAFEQMSNERFRLLLESRGTENLNEIALLIVYACIHELKIRSDVNSEKLVIIDHYLSENAFMIQRLCEEIYRIIDSNIADDLKGLLSANSRLIKLYELFQKESTELEDFYYSTDSLSEEEFYSVDLGLIVNSKIKKYKKLEFIFDVILGDKNSSVKCNNERIDYLNSIRYSLKSKSSEQVQGQVFKFDLSSRLFVYIFILFSYISQYLMRLYMIFYKLKNHSNKDLKNSKKYNVLNFIDTKIGSIFKRRVNAYKQFNMKLKLLFLTKNADESKFNNYLEKLTSKLDVAEAIIWQIILTEFNSGNIHNLFLKLDEVKININNYFKNEDLILLKHNYAFVINDEIPASKDVILATYYKLLYNKDKRLADYFYKICLYDVVCDSTNDGRLSLLKSLIVKSFEKGAYNDILSVLHDFSYSIQMCDYYSFLSALCEPQSLNKDLELLNKKCWINIKDVDWKKACAYDGFAKFLNKTEIWELADFKLISYELRNNYNSNVIFDFQISNRRLIKKINSDMSVLFPELAGMQSEDTEKDYSLYSYDNLVEMALLTPLNRKKYIQTAEEIEGAMYFKRRDCLHLIPSAEFAKIVTTYSGENRRVLVTYFQKFLFKHNAFREQFNFVLQNTLRDKESVIKNAYRLFLDARHLHKEQSESDIEFLKEINKYVLVDL